MSYNIAYTSQFGDPDGILWRVDIYRDGYTGNPAEIGLDAEQPVIIEWQETKLQDAVCPSQCTLKVINDSDRLMVPLMTDDYVYCKIYRDNKLYWTGVLDQGVYEEPYSYNDGYITEITFSDFGALNRFDFNPFSRDGRSDYIVSIHDIVSAALSMININVGNMSQNVSMILPDQGAGSACLQHIFVNSRRFQGMTIREVLEEILRPLSYRIVQMAGVVYVYDIDWMYDTAAVTPVEWMGDDARLSGSEAYGLIALNYDHEAEPLIADGSIDPDDAIAFAEHDRYCNIYTDEVTQRGVGYYLDKYRVPLSWNLLPVTILDNVTMPFRTRGVLQSTKEAFFARRIFCWDDVNSDFYNILAKSTIIDINNIGGMLEITTSYIPCSDDLDKYELLVRLDMILTPKSDPYDTRVGDDSEYDSQNIIGWKRWKKGIVRLHVPTKLELLDDGGNPVMHYRNMNSSESYLYPLPYKKGTWHEGPGTWDMVLSYYQDGLEETPFKADWVTNRQTISKNQKKLAGCIGKKEDGEYIPMPPSGGRLRLTIGNGVLASDDNVAVDLNYFSGLGTDTSSEYIKWQLYRNPSITVVKSNLADNRIDTEAVTGRYDADANKDSYEETHYIGTSDGKTSSASLGLLMDASGHSFRYFIKKGVSLPLIQHRLNSLRDQLATVHSTLSGTARLTPVMCVHTDASTAGRFLATALRQDPRHGTEEISMTRISPGGDRYTFAWSGPVCATEEGRYRHRWSNPVCLHVPEHYTFTWSGPVCARVDFVIGPVWIDL